CLLLTVFSSISCSSDDDNGGQDPIVGKWQWTSTVEFVNGEQQPKEELSECERKSSIEFNADGSASSNFFDTNGVGECIGEDSYPFTWVNKGNNIYGFFIEDEAEEDKVTFDGNTMKIFLTYMDGDIE